MSVKAYRLYQQESKGKPGKEAENSERSNFAIRKRCNRFYQISVADFENKEQRSVFPLYTGLLSPNSKERTYRHALVDYHSHRAGNKRGGGTAVFKSLQDSRVGAVGRVLIALSWTKNSTTQTCLLPVGTAHGRMH